MRPNRQHFIGGIYHVMLRGNNKQIIFLDNNDQLKFLALLSEIIKKYLAKLHAYCLMPNHIHLIFEVNTFSLSSIMHSLECRYVKFFNKKYKRSGHLFQGRYKSISVTRDRYFLNLIRYLHQNPVRARLIKTIDDPWNSSHFAYLGNEDIPWLTKQLILSYFDNTKVNIIDQYRAYMSYTLNKEEIKELLKQQKLNDRIPPESFTKSTQVSETSVHVSPLYTIENILELCEKEFKTSRYNLISNSRTKNVARVRILAITLAYLTKTDSLKNLASYFSKNYSTLSKQVNNAIQNEQLTLALLKEKLC